MKALHLHIGIHKTATTSLQRTLAGSRAELLQAGLYYPDYTLIGAPGHYCHHSVARVIGGVSDEVLDAARARDFFVQLGRSTPDNGICMLSSEIFYRLSVNDYRRRVDFIRAVRDHLALTGLPVKIIITLREQASFIDSLYREHVKQTRYSEDFPAFLRQFAPWLDYRHQIQLWRNVFEDIQVVIYEDLNRDTLVEDFIFKTTGIPVAINTTAQANPSLNYDWTLVKRMLNYTSFSGGRIKTAGSILQSLQRACSKDHSPNSPRAHFITADDAAYLYNRHAANNIKVSSDYGVLVGANPFEPLAVIPPAQKMVNPRLLREAITWILAKEAEDTATVAKTIDDDAYTMAEARAAWVPCVV